MEILTFEDPEVGKKAFLAYRLSRFGAGGASAVPHLRNMAIGPAIENGFYYDFDVEKPSAAEDLEAIEAEMAKIVKERYRTEPV